MKKAKLNNSKKVEKVKEEIPNQEITAKGVFITLLSILVVFAGFYFLTSYIIDSRKVVKEPVAEEEDTSIISFKDLYKQEQGKEGAIYFVLAQLENDPNAEKYEKYTTGMTPLAPLYRIDMSDAFNKSHIGEETVVSEVVKDIVISDTTLFVIKDKKVESYHVGYDEILEYIISMM